MDRGEKQGWITTWMRQTEQREKGHSRGSVTRTPQHVWKVLLHAHGRISCDVDGDSSLSVTPCSMFLV